MGWGKFAKFHPTAFPFLLLHPSWNFACGCLPSSKGESHRTKCAPCCPHSHPLSPAMISPPCSSRNHRPQAAIGPLLHEALLALQAKKTPPAWLTAHVLRLVQFFKIPWTDCQAPLSMERILEGVAISYFRGSSQPRDWNCISCISCFGGGFFTTEPPGNPHHPVIFLFFLCVWHMYFLFHILNILWSSEPCQIQIWFLLLSTLLGTLWVLYQHLLSESKK